MDQRIIWLCFKFGTMPWSDQPFNVHLVPQDIRATPPDLTGEQRALLNVLLVEAETGIVKAIRAVTFSHDFSVKLHEAICAQCREPVPSHLLDRREYDAMVDNTYGRYLTSDAMVRKGLATCRGGD